LFSSRSISVVLALGSLSKAVFEDDVENGSVMDNFGPKFQGVNYGIVFIGYSTAAFVAPKVTAGIAAANNGDFTKAFYVAIVVAVAGLILDLVYKKKTATKAITETAQ